MKRPNLVYIFADQLRHDVFGYGYYVQRYVGHVPSSIGERHYHGDRGHRMLPLFRDKVLVHIEEEIATWPAPVDTPVLPGPRLATSAASS